jgi:hypothetical protein
VPPLYRNQCHDDPVLVAELLEAIARAIPDLHGAACRVHLELFDVDDRRDRAAIVRRASDLCVVSGAGRVPRVDGRPAAGVPAVWCGGGPGVGGAAPIGDQSASAGSAPGVPVLRARVFGAL